MSASPALPEKTRETYTPEDLPRFVNDECQECGIPVRGKRSQRRHALGHLPDLVPGHHATKRPYVCTHCDCRFVTKSTMQVHADVVHV